jgi:hypothetical protein
MITALLCIAILFQFTPVRNANYVNAASYCNWVGLVADVSVPDGSNFRPGESFTKTWRLKNIGTCTWTTSYLLVFSKGDFMEAPSSVFSLYREVKPGETIDLGVPLKAPASPGHYRGYWMLKSGTGNVFGIGSSAADPFWADINVVSDLGGAYDFTANVCAATWRSGAGILPCPMVDGDSRGFAVALANPKMENGAQGTAPGLLLFPENKYNGYLQGTYPEITVQAGDRFQGIVGCAYGSACYVTYRLDYQENNGALKIFWKWTEKNEGQIYRVDKDLSALAGKKVKFTLTLLAAGSALNDRALWVQPVIARSGGSLPLPTVPLASPTPTPVTPTPTVAPMSGSVAFDFATNVGVATWRNGSGPLPCPSNDPGCGAAAYVATPRLEDNTVDVLPGILVSPQYKTDGYIQGTYIPIPVQAGDHFRSAIGCAYGKPCYVTFRLDYQVNNGPLQNLGQWTERNEGKVTHVDIDLNALAGQNVQFVFSLFAAGSPANDSAIWAHPFLMRPGAPTPTATPLVSPTPTSPPVSQPNTLYDFALNACAASWASGAGALPCPGTDGSPGGFVLPVMNPQLESGAVDNAYGLVMFPQYVTNGYLRGVYPEVTVQAGDRFRSIINCAYGSACYATFKLEYQIGSGPITTLASWVEKKEGLFWLVEKDLSALAGKNVKFILTVLATGSPTGDRALWSQPRLVRSGYGPSPTPTPTATPTVPAAGVVTNVEVSVNPIFTACQGPNVVDFLGKITTDGPVMVSYHWEIGGDSNTTTSTETVTFASAGLQTINPGPYKVDCGNYTVRLVVTAPNPLSAQADFSVQPPTPLPFTNVLVYFADQNVYGAERPVQRSVSASNLPLAVLRELYKGPTAEEQASGLMLITSGTTGVSQVSVVSGIAHVTLSGPCNSQGATYTVGNLIRASLNQFPEIQHVRIYDESGNTGNPDPGADSIPACLEP